MPGPPPEILISVASALLDETDAAAARLWLLLPDDRCPLCRDPGGSAAAHPGLTLHLAGQAGSTGRERAEHHRVPLGAGGIGLVARRNTASYVNGLARDERFMDQSPYLADLIRDGGLYAGAAYPLTSGGDLVGVLAVFFRRAIEPVEFELLGVFAHQAACAIRGALPVGYDRPDDLATLEQVERTHIERTLGATGGRIAGPRGAAAALGLHPNTLRSRMEKLGIGRRKGDRVTR